MDATHSQDFDVIQLNETVQSLQLQLSEVSQRLSRVEEIMDPSSSILKRNNKGDASFLGTKYQKPEVKLETGEGTENCHFLGNNYTRSDAKVVMKSDGTKRTFLGREFEGQTLDK